MKFRVTIFFIMKYITNIILIFFALIFIDGCKDSLGLDVYQKTLLKKDSTDNHPNNSAIFPVDSVLFSFSEQYSTSRYKGDTTSIMQTWVITQYSQNVLMDTSTNNYAMWLNLKLFNRTPDVFYSPRKDRVYSLEIKLDSAVIDILSPGKIQTYFLNGNVNEGKWSSLMIKQFTSADTTKGRDYSRYDSTIYSELRARVRLNFVKSYEAFIVNQKQIFKDYIKGTIWADFPLSDSLETFRFEGEIKIFYK